MPVQTTYPGVYVEEIPSGVRTITGVATSVTAFFGRARRGPVNRPVTITSFADFDRVFGGLWGESPLGFAVSDFYRNGGSRAVIVRLYNPEEGEPTRATLTATAAGTETLPLIATEEGTWGNGLTVTVSHPPAGDLTDEIADRLGVAATDLFDLRINDPAGDTEEDFRNLTMVASTRRVDQVLANESRLARFSGNFPDPAPARPSEGETTVAEADEASDGIALVNGNYLDLETNPDPPDDDAPYFASEARKTGLFALEDADLVNLMVIPPPAFGTDVPLAIWTDAAAYAARRRALLVVDPPSTWNSAQDAESGLADVANAVGPNKKNAALYFPCYLQPNPTSGGQELEMAPSGAVAGVMARTDTARGVWKAPAGLDAGLAGVTEFCVPLTDLENGLLNPLGVNALRMRPAAGPVVWGARTLDGNDQLASEWKYVPVRRLALFIEESLYRGTQWVVFEPNDEPLWAQIRLNVGAFMQNLFRQGAFQGSTPQDAYLVKCDAETTTQNDIDRGIVNVLVGFAPLKPAEFVILKIQQLAGQIQT